MDVRSSLEDRERHRGTVDSVTALLVEAGFETPEVFTDSFTMRFADGSTMLRHFLIRLGFLSEWRAIAPVGRAPDVLEALRVKLDQRAGSEGLSLTVPMACFDCRARPLSPVAR